MARVLVTSTPGLGHVLPLLRVAGALRERGHDVRWVVGPEACARVEAAGYAVTPGGLGERERFALLHARYPEAAVMRGAERRAFTFPRMFGEVGAAAMAPDLVAVADAWRPDVVVRDAAELAAPMVAARLGVPCVVHAFGLPIPRAAAASADAYLEPLWAAYGVPFRPWDEADALYLDICPPALHNGEHPPCARQEVRPADGAPPRRGPTPLAYVTMGTMFNQRPDLFRTLVAGVAAAGADVLVTVGADGDPDALDPLPNVTVERFVPQDEVLPRASVVVSHGGSGTTFATLAHGLPTLLAPQAADQFDNAFAVEASGAGIAFTGGDPGAADVAAAVRRLLAEASFAAAAAEVARGIAAMPSPYDAMAAVESL